MSQQRWERLQTSLAAAGIEAKVTCRAYLGGVSRSIWLNVPGGRVVIQDSFWHDLWTGWQVWAEGADSITVWERMRIKGYSQAVAAVQAAIASLVAPQGSSSQRSGPAKTFPARYRATCRDCGEPITPGSMVGYVGRFLVHADCDDSGTEPLPQAPEKVCSSCFMTTCDCGKAI